MNNRGMTINRALGRSHAQGRLQEKASKESQRQAEEFAAFEQAKVDKRQRDKDAGLGFRV